MSTEINLHKLNLPFRDLQDAEKTGLTGWRQLAVLGYGFKWDEELGDKEFQNEYCYPHRESELIALSEGNRVIGTMVLSKSDLYPGLRTFGIHGIVVLPEYTNRGLGKHLYEVAFQQMNIDVLKGTTKTPGLVATAARIGERFGYRSFYGYTEVTSERESGFTQDHSYFIEKHLDEKVKSKDRIGPVYFRETTSLLPYVPDVSGFPTFIQNAFIPVIEAQKMVGETKTAASFLVSIKRSFLNQ